MLLRFTTFCFLKVFDDLSRHSIVLFSLFLICLFLFSQWLSLQTLSIRLETIIFIIIFNIVSDSIKFLFSTTLFIRAVIKIFSLQIWVLWYVPIRTYLHILFYGFSSRWCSWNGFFLDWFLDSRSIKFTFFVRQRILFRNCFRYWFFNQTRRNLLGLW